MVASSMSTAESQEAAFARLSPPTESSFPDKDHAIGYSVGRPASARLVEAPAASYALSADYISGSRCNVTEGSSPKMVR
jgi:hypothetical protein